MFEAFAIVIAYLLGSIPSAYIISRQRKGIDIREAGGGNMGALNTAREVGLSAGIAVLAADVAKGSLAVVIARLLGLSMIWVFGAGFAAIIGHNLPVFIKFRGGKGAAATIGVFLALAPVELTLCIILMLAVIFFTSNVTLGMAAGFVVLPIAMWRFGEPNILIFYVAALVVFQGLRYVRTAMRGLAKAGSVKDFIVDKNYKPWQSKRK